MLDPTSAIAAAFVVVPYVVGFGVAFPVRSWRSHLPASMAVVTLAAGLAWVTSRTSFFLGAILFFPIAGLVAGLSAGLATRAIVLAARWPIPSLRAAMATLIGFALPPLGWEGWRHLREQEVRSALTRLPDAQTLPRIAACERFRASGALFDTIFEAPYGDSSDRRPRSDRSLRYPVAYRTSEPIRPETTGNRARYIGFAMYVADASPVPPEERRFEFAARGRVEPKRPYVSFAFADHAPIDRRLARRFAVRSAKTAEDRRPSQIVRTPSSLAALDEITSMPPRSGPEREDVFTSRTDGPVSDLLICSKDGAAPKPTCDFTLERGDLAVTGDFRRTELEHWPQIADHVRSFVDCVVAAGDATTAGGL